MRLTMMSVIKKSYVRFRVILFLFNCLVSLIGRLTDDGVTDVYRMCVVISSMNLIYDITISYVGKFDATVLYLILL